MMDRRGIVGWLLVLGISVAVTLAGLYVLAVPISADFFRQTTGLEWGAFAAGEPEVAAYLERTARLAGVTSTSFGVFAVVITWSRLRNGNAWAARAMWILPLALAAWTVLFVADGITMLTSFYGPMAVLAGVGLVLAASARDRSPARQSGTAHIA